MPIACAPLPCSCAPVASTASCFRSLTEIRAPDAARVCATARPMPDTPPVTIAVLPGTPARSSSRIRSLINTLASTDRPTDNARPAKPGRVMVAPNIDITATTISRLHSIAIEVITPNMR
ncbi:hypothetical protein G6F63_015703 [Rhizopus arrhizus]|nr:hypothetical protein G6F63_015703 [Rhizopus arrhizus]